MFVARGLVWLIDIIDVSMDKCNKPSAHTSVVAVPDAAQQLASWLQKTEVSHYIPQCSKLEDYIILYVLLQF